DISPAREVDCGIPGSISNVESNGFVSMLAEQVIQTNLRPGLELFTIANQFFHLCKPCLYHRLFTWENFWRVDIKNVHNSQMDSADFRKVRVQQSHALIGEGGVEDDLFANLAAHPLQVRRTSPIFILRGNMPPHSNRALAMQSPFPLQFATRV